MNVDDRTFDPSEFCSRKLWQLVNQSTDSGCSEDELREAIAELAERRHYLKELEELGKL
ncbi:MAG: hypothetical protein AAGI11_21645 [Pseudomonadota bacterium]